MRPPAIPSAFGWASTAAEVLRGVDLRGRLVIVTGAAGGIGKATAEAFARAGADVVLGARNETALEAARRDVADPAAGGRAWGFPLDLMSTASVEAFADAVIALSRPVDVLVNNAGIIGPLRRNAAGLESQLMTNFLGHALLTSRLAPRLVEAGRARLVSLTSFGHHYSPVVLDDLNFERRPYNAWLGYGQSKTACVLLAVHAQRRLGARGVDAFAVHPGAIMTGLGKDMLPEDFALAAERGSVPRPEEFKTPEAGAATTAWAATAPQLSGQGGLYLEDCGVAQVRTVPNYRSGVMDYALDADVAARLWTAAESLLKRGLPL